MVMSAAPISALPTVGAGWCAVPFVRSTDPCAGNCGFCGPCVPGPYGPLPSLTGWPSFCIPGPPGTPCVAEVQPIE